MSDTVQKYRDYVMTGFVKSLAPIVIDRASGAKVWDENGREYLDCFSGISGVDDGDSGEAFQIFAPIFIPDFGAAGAVNDDRSQGLHEAGRYVVSIVLDTVRHK